MLKNITSQVNQSVQNTSISQQNKQGDNDHIENSNVTSNLSKIECNTNFNKDFRNLEYLRGILMQSQYLTVFLKDSQEKQNNNIDNEFYDRLIQFEEIQKENTNLSLRILKMKVIKSLEQILEIETPCCNIIFERLDDFVLLIQAMSEYLNGCIRKVYIGDGLLEENIKQLLESFD
ncbi:hypothetical protein PPERSA_10470 [Pseudocohnilembus persalinus]|uniref:Uncharacterized protein n=1 Tax=Pseudocohnilembus persalinus TaxID=266149 RepID=A0A0V0R7B6_PSEPJ|nr:hypothetical protein PPERSA_10470 [Pseudocohnilembus persalinus]|eukprot:KRX10371.1 hypothetical protein PPERSA_10470 [Pseudocohnilembus persalinus]